MHQGSFLKIQLHDMGFKDSVIMGEVVFSCTDGWVSKFDGFVDMSGVNATPGSWRTSFSGVPVLDVQILYDDVDHHPIVPSAPPGPDPVDVASVQGLTPGPDSVQGPAVQGLGLPIHAFLNPIFSSSSSPFYLFASNFLLDSGSISRIDFL